jgi:hypothetical protein
MVVHFFRFRYSPEIFAAAKRRFLPLVFVAGAAFFWFLKISFALEVLNALALFIAVACLVHLIFFAFKLTPRKMFSVAALLAALTVLVTLPIFVIDALAQTKTVDVGHNRVCKQTGYGFAGSDSGTRFEIYQRFLIFERRLFIHVDSDLYPEQNVLVPDAWIKAISLCRDIQKKI